jgi:alkylmercury lyase
MDAERFELLSRAILDAFPSHDEASARVSRAVYTTLGRGAPATMTKIAEHAAVAPARIEAYLSSWPGVFRDDAGAVVAFLGLTLSPRDHQLRVGRRILYAWCAWDTLFLPELLGEAAEVTSRSPSGDDVILRVDRHGAVTPNRDGIVVSFVTPGDALGPDVMTTFCRFVHFFPDEASGQRWGRSRGHTNIEFLSLAQAAALARQKNAPILYPAASS